MDFRKHPVFDDSEKRDWLELSDDVDTLSPEMELFKDLIDVYREHQEYIEQKALHRVKTHVGDATLLYICRNEVLFAPLGNHGFKVYFEFYFREKDEPSADSDYWWAIMWCGNVFDERFGPGRKRHWNVAYMGWTVE